MIFTSLNFLLFFPVLVVLYYVTPINTRRYILLLASILFYLNISPLYLLLLMGVCTSTYAFTRAIAKTEDENKKQWYKTGNIILILLPLLFFKYFSAINNGLLEILTQNGLRWPLPKLEYLLPVGISYYTFVAIGYTIDVYNEEVEAEKDFGIVALFVSFFPLILSGPIERAGNMIPQFKKLPELNYSNITAGLKLMLWGFFMKLVVADRLGIYVNMVFNNVPNHNGVTLFLASCLYPFQVYNDLGGYSLIAIGTAKAMGIDVIHNFKRPFLATSMAELWRRWHISLITWMTDYVYTPLAFSFRKFKLQGTIMALFLTFLISGIWHGATWTFVAWGVIQGIYLSIEALTQKQKTAFEQKYNLKSNWIYLIFSMLTTYFLFTISQIFAGSANVPTALLVFKKIATQHGMPYLDLTTLFFALFGLAVVLAKDISEEFFQNKFGLLSSSSFAVRCTGYLLLAFSIILFGVFTGGSFIYFQF